jgi:hypothetical protein
VAIDNAFGIIFDRAERDETLADEPLAGIGYGEFLEVGKHRGLCISRQNSGGDPVLQLAAERV